MNIFFDGYCPESQLRGEQVEMRVNDEDFWESEATGLQITVFPPFAAILRWRGKGKFRQSSDVASNSLTGLILTGAQEDEGNEILPNEENIIEDSFDLESYLEQIYPGKEEYDASKFNPNDPAFAAQEKYLNTIAQEEFHKLTRLFDKIRSEAPDGNLMSSETFNELHKLLYEQKLIFSFNWMAWHKGWKNINDTSFDYSKCSLLDLSMYLTAIFRSDRFCDGTIEQNYRNGTLDKIFGELKSRQYNPPVLLSGPTNN